MIRATNQLTEKERKDAKNIDCQLPSLGPTLSRTLSLQYAYFRFHHASLFPFIIKMEVAWFINGLCG